MRTAVVYAWLLAALAVGGQAAFAPRALAQGSSASLAISAQGVASGVVVGEASLTFGLVVPGVATTVDATAPTAARFGGVFPPDSRLRLTLTVPAQLTSGSNALPVGGWTARFSPTQSTIVRVHRRTAAMTVFVGGAVTPAAAQASGVYVGAITPTATFVGF